MGYIFMKGLAVAIILLFLGVAFAPSINAIKNEKSEETELEIRLYTTDKNWIRHFDVVNIGDNDAINVSWNLSFKGGLILIGRKYGENLNFPIDPDSGIRIGIGPNRYYLVSYRILGIGMPSMTITANADNAEKVEKTYDTFLFLNLLFKM